MKFVSKLSNLRLVLRPGLPGNRQLGTPSIPGSYVRFEDGMAEVKSSELIELMLNHPQCGKDGDQNADFFPLKEDEADPFANKRVSMEPEHAITTLEYGHIGKSINKKMKAKLTDEQMDLVKSLAKEMAMEIIAKSQVRQDVDPMPQPDVSSDFSKLAPEPIEDTKEDFFPEEDEIEVAPKIENFGSKENSVENAEGNTEGIPSDEPKRRGRPSTKK